MSKLDDSCTDSGHADCSSGGGSFVSGAASDTEDPYFSQSDDEKQKVKQFRDLAEGKNLNNSFHGAYPANWDHLHLDKGPNPQFM